MGERIHYELHGRASVLRLDDGRANAMQLEWCDELGAALDRAEADDTSCVILIGRPGFFSAGLDLKVLPDLDPAALRHTTNRFMASMRRVFLFPKPVIAASTGHAIAGGMMLYLAADLRLALDRPDARYGLNEAVTGIPLLGGTAGICQYAIPRRHHTELILHGRMLDARESLDRGVTHELVEDGDALLDRALARAAALADVEPRAYRTNKRILREPAYDRAVEVAARVADEAPAPDVFARLKL